MKVNWTFLAIALIASVTLCRVTADSKEGAEGTKNTILPKTHGNDGKVKETADPAKGEASGLDKNLSGKQLESQGGVKELKKVDDSSQKDERKENKGSDNGSKKELKEGRLPPVREKCDSSSNSCMDDDKTFIACLRVPGNESPDLSLLIQNKGKGTLSIAISAPDLVKLEKEKIELQENKDTEVKVSISDLGSDHFIVLKAGSGNCSLNFKDQYLALKKVDHSSESAQSSIFNIALPTGFLVLAVLLILVASVFLYTKLKVRFSTRKGLPYQKLDADIPISHGSKLEAGENEGWDNSWGDSWDDEEAPKTPPLPLTSSLSSKGMASRKVSKDAWKD